MRKLLSPENEPHLMVLNEFLADHIYGLAEGRSYRSAKGPNSS